MKQTDVLFSRRGGADPMPIARAEKGPIRAYFKSLARRKATVQFV
jgi:hypothetical protein